MLSPVASVDTGLPSLIFGLPGANVDFASKALELLNKSIVPHYIQAHEAWMVSANQAHVHLDRTAICYHFPGL